MSSASPSGSGRIYDFTGVRVTADQKLEYLTIFRNKHKKTTSWILDDDVPEDVYNKEHTIFYQHLEKNKTAESNEFKYCQKPSKEAMEANNDGNMFFYFTNLNY